MARNKNPRPPVPEWLIPEPQGFDDEVKREAARAERTWETASGAFGSLAAVTSVGLAAGLAFPPMLAPVCVAIGAGGLFFKSKAKWAKEDPPNEQYQSPAQLPQRTMATWLLDDEQTLGSLAHLPAVLFGAGDRLGACVESVEKSMGAAIVARRNRSRAAARASEQRREEAREFAFETAYMLTSVADFARRSAERLGEVVPEYLQGGAFTETTDILDVAGVGRLIAAGFWEEVRDFIPSDEVPNGPVGSAAPRVLTSCAESSELLAVSLAGWAAGDGGGSQPATPSPSGPLNDPGGGLIADLSGAQMGGALDLRLGLPYVEGALDVP